jgi:hypothetical protein
MKTDSPSKTYYAWQRYILTHYPKLPKDVERIKLIAFCQTLAYHGRMGVDCFASDVLLGKELGIGRKYLKKYRQTAVDIGWFKPNGIKAYRVEHLDIAIPVEVEAVEVEQDQAPDEWAPAPVVERVPVSKPIDEDDPWLDQHDPWLDAA